MAKELPDRCNGDPSLHQPGGECVAKGMEDDTLPPVSYAVVESALFDGFSVDAVDPLNLIVVLGEDMFVVDAGFDVAFNHGFCLGVERNKAVS